MDIEDTSSVASSSSSASSHSPYDYSSNDDETYVPASSTRRKKPGRKPNADKPRQDVLKKMKKRIGTPKLPTATRKKPTSVSRNNRAIGIPSSLKDSQPHSIGRPGSDLDDSDSSGDDEDDEEMERWRLQQEAQSMAHKKDMKNRYPGVYEGMNDTVNELQYTPQVAYFGVTGTQNNQNFNEIIINTQEDQEILLENLAHWAGIIQDDTMDIDEKQQQLLTMQISSGNTSKDNLDGVEYSDMESIQKKTAQLMNCPDEIDYDRFNECGPLLARGLMLKLVEAADQLTRQEKIDLFTNDSVGYVLVITPPGHIQQYKREPIHGEEACKSQHCVCVLHGLGTCVQYEPIQEYIEGVSRSEDDKYPKKTGNCIFCESYYLELLLELVDKNIREQELKPIDKLLAEQHELEDKEGTLDAKTYGYMRFLKMIKRLQTHTVLSNVVGHYNADYVIDQSGYMLYVSPFQRFVPSAHVRRKQDGITWYIESDEMHTQEESNSQDF